MEFKTIYFHKDQFADYSDFMKDFHEDKDLDEAIPRRKWWIFENIYDGYFILAYNQNEVASTCFISGKKIYSGGEEIFCFEIGETWTGEKFRRNGLFTKMVKKAMEIGFSAGAEVIYGTPNAQSSPGYRKLKYFFIGDESDCLVLLPNAINIGIRKAGLKKETDLKSIEIDGSYKPKFKNIEIAEIKFEEYLKGTKDFKRMNCASDEYMEWRFEKSFHNYRFFCGTGKKGEFYCCIKPHQLGNLNCILISEYFLNGKLDKAAGKYEFLRLIGSAYYDDHDGMYMKNSTKKSALKYYDMTRNRYLIHRHLPICYFPKDIEGEKIHKIMANLLNNFQLSDCDIG